ELRKLAARRLAHERPGQTLQATALVHEAYLRLVGPGPVRTWDSRGHFFAAAAQAMRRILVDSARRKQTRRHGGDHRREDLGLDALVGPEPEMDLLALDAALERLAEREPQKARLPELRYFAGLTGDPGAPAPGVPPP